MHPVTFGYAGKWFPNAGAVQQAAYLVKSDPTPVGMEAFQPNPATPPMYRVVTRNEYWQAAQGGRLAWTAMA